MKSLGIALIAGLVLCGTAWAEDDDDTPNWIPPKFDVIHQRWPRGPDGVPIYGKIKMLCGADSKGYASDCVVQSTEPANNINLVEGGPSIAALYKSKTKLSGRQILNLKLIYDTSPDWLHKPTLSELLAVYPRAARGQAGHATIACIVKIDGLLRACEVKNEHPDGAGFGSASLVLSSTFLMKPALRDGHPVETEITIPITFESTSFGGGDPVTVLGAPIWSKTPTIQEILSELDKKVGDRFADGKVVFQCDVSKKIGTIKNCILVNTSPSMTGFTGAARSLTSKFQIDPNTLTNIKSEVRVNLAFSFPDMQSAAWGKRYMTRPQWTRTVIRDANQPIFPIQAAEAGLKIGSATVDCVIGVDGTLGQCAVLNESAPNVGFGVLAQQIAQTFATNPWTDDGLPAEGAHVKMPIKMVDNEKAPDAALPAKP